MKNILSERDDKVAKTMKILAPTWNWNLMKEIANRQWELCTPWRPQQNLHQSPHLHQTLNTAHAEGKWSWFCRIFSQSFYAARETSTSQTATREVTTGANSVNHQKAEGVVTAGVWINMVTRFLGSQAGRGLCLVHSSHLPKSLDTSQCQDRTLPELSEEKIKLQTGSLQSILLDIYRPTPERVCSLSWDRIWQK